LNCAKHIVQVSHKMDLERRVALTRFCLPRPAQRREVHRRRRYCCSASFLRLDIVGIHDHRDAVVLQKSECYTTSQLLGRDPERNELRVPFLPPSELQPLGVT
jgi:hypothetical protein